MFSFASFLFFRTMPNPDNGFLSLSEPQQSVKERSRSSGSAVTGQTTWTLYLKVGLITMSRQFEEYMKIRKGNSTSFSLNFTLKLLQSFSSLITRVISEYLCWFSVYASSLKAILYASLITAYISFTLLPYIKDLLLLDLFFVAVGPNLSAFLTDLFLVLHVSYNKL